MKRKKTKKADLNNYSSTFILIGLALISFISWKSIEAKMPTKQIELGTIDVNTTEIPETIEINLEEKKPKIKKIKKVEIEKIAVKKDNDKVIESIVKSSETDEIEPVDAVYLNTDDDNVDDEIINVSFIFIQNAPVYPGCEGKKGENLKKCMSEKISKFVNNEFDMDLASEVVGSGKTRISTQFTINTKGKIVNIKTRSKYKDLEKEARRIIAKLPKMKPGKQRGRLVNVTYTLPIIFNIEE
jgi:protein TonB